MLMPRTRYVKSPEEIGRLLDAMGQVDYYT